MSANEPRTLAPCYHFGLPQGIVILVDHLMAALNIKWLTSGAFSNPSVLTTIIETARAKQGRYRTASARRVRRAAAASAPISAKVADVSVNGG